MFDKDLDMFKFFDLETRELNYSTKFFLECKVVVGLWNGIVPETCGKDHLVKTFRGSIKWARDHYEESHAEK